MVCRFGPNWWERRQTSHHRIAEVVEPLHPSPTAALPLVGREHELATLRQAIDDARHARTTVVHLVGGAGLGKSRLILEACRTAVASGAVVLTGAATDPAGLTPFATVRSVFDGLREFRPRNETRTTRPPLPAVTCQSG